MFETYLPQILTVVAILTPLVPTFILRKISDSNMLKTFGKIRDVAIDVTSREVDLSGAIARVNNTAKFLQNNIKLLDDKLEDKIKKIDTSVLEFQQGDLYQKMLLGLSQLDELQQLLAVKDDTIKTLGEVIKSINKKLKG